jgi:hypothetical protein
MYTELKQRTIFLSHQVILFSVLIIIQHVEAKILDFQTLETFDGNSNEKDDSDSARRIVIKDGVVNLSLPGNLVKYVYFFLDDHKFGPRIKLLTVRRCD